MFSKRGRSESVKKSHFYVCFLGAKEARGLRGPEVALPVLKALTQEAQIAQSIKLTLQISNKGMKIFQPVPMINKHGRIKMEMLKFLIPHYSICYSMVGPPPLNDTVAVVMLIFNPETRCPVHVHCYRCDSLQTAQVMNSALQTLTSRPENAERFADLEMRLINRGFLPAAGGYRPKNRHLPHRQFTSLGIDSAASIDDRNQYGRAHEETNTYQTHHHNEHHHHVSESREQNRHHNQERGDQRRHHHHHLTNQSTSFPDEKLRDQETSTTIDRLMAAAHMAHGTQRSSSGFSYDSVPEQDEETERMIRMHRALFDELKTKVAARRRTNQFNLLSYPQDYLNTWRQRRIAIANRPIPTEQYEQGGLEFTNSQAKYLPKNSSVERSERYWQDVPDMHVISSPNFNQHPRKYRRDQSEPPLNAQARMRNLQFPKTIPSSHGETSSTSGLGSDADSSGSGTNKRPEIEVTDFGSGGANFGSGSAKSEDQGFESSEGLTKKREIRKFAQHGSTNGGSAFGKPLAKDKALARRYNLPIEVDDSTSEIYATPQFRCFGDTLKYEIKGSGKTNAGISNVERLRKLGLSTSALPDATSKPSVTQEYCDPHELEGSGITSLSPKESPNNWITKPSKFFSMEDISRQMSYLNLPNLPGARGSLASNNNQQRDHLQESLWHLPSVVDPFGKRCVQSTNLLTGTNGLWNHTKRGRQGMTPGRGSRNDLSGLAKGPRSQSCWDVRRSSLYIPMQG